MSTRVEGAPPPVIRITAQATITAGETYLTLTVKQVAADLWHYSLSAARMNRLAYGKIIMPDHITALRRTAEICTHGFALGTVERGLLEDFALNES